MGLAILLGLIINFNYSQNYAEDEQSFIIY